MTLLISLFLIGSALVVAEVVFPSFGMLGLLSAAAFLVAIMKSFEEGRQQGYIAIVATVILAPLAFGLGVRLLQRTRIGGKFLLSGPDRASVSGAAAESHLRNYLGRKGVTSTPLRPSGIVEIDEHRLDAVSDGGFIDAGVGVQVILVEGNRLVVTVTNS